MRHEGIARLDKRTKDLVKRLGPDDIAVIDHVDMDRVSAEALLETGVEVVVNASRSISGVYPNLGPLLLARGGVRIIDDAGAEVFDKLGEGDRVVVTGGSVRRKDKVVASGEVLTVEVIEEAMESARDGLGEQLDSFARNTLEFLDKEKALLLLNKIRNLQWSETYYPQMREYLQNFTTFIQTGEVSGRSGLSGKPVDDEQPTMPQPTSGPARTRILQ
jgi:uncharacterized membrane-anchored protein